MALLFPSQLTEKYGYQKLLKPLIDDLKVLETTGVLFKFEGHTHKLRGTVTMVVTDNLAAHALGGFFCNFSTVQKFCRFCNISKNQLLEDSNRKDWVLRTKEIYDYTINQLSGDPGISSAYGIKEKSCLNDLHYFHVAEGLPPDIAHDIFEGVAVDVISNIIHLLLEEKLITLEDINNKISCFSYSNVDKSNKPQPLKIFSGSNFKLKETACEMWNLIRLLPLMLGGCIQETNEAWKCLIKFCVLVERLCANSFTDSDITILTMIIDDFFESYFKILPDINLKPKAHFLKHYPQMIKLFGPLLKTLRFEAKHQYFKNLSHLSKNRKNIYSSMAKRHQFMMYLHYVKDSFLEYSSPHMLNVMEAAPVALDILLSQAVKLKLSLAHDEIFMKGTGLVYGGQKYLSGDTVVINFLNDEYQFGLIDSVISHNGKFYLVCVVLVTQYYDSHFNSYKVYRSDNVELFLIEQLMDYHPLGMYQVGQSQYISLKYHISIPT